MMHWRLAHTYGDDRAQGYDSWYIEVYWDFVLCCSMVNSGSRGIMKAVQWIMNYKDYSESFAFSHKVRFRRLHMGFTCR